MVLKDERKTCNDCLGYEFCSSTFPNRSITCSKFKDRTEYVKSEILISAENEIKRLRKLLDDKCDRCIERERNTVKQKILGALLKRIADNDNLFERCASRLVSNDYANGRSETIGFILNLINELLQENPEVKI